MPESITTTVETSHRSRRCGFNTRGRTIGLDLRRRRHCRSDIFSLLRLNPRRLCDRGLIRGAGLSLIVAGVTSQHQSPVLEKESGTNYIILRLQQRSSSHPPGVATFSCCVRGCRRFDCFANWQLEQRTRSMSSIHNCFVEIRSTLVTGKLY